MNKRKNILIVGVGGQGVLLASEIIAKAALQAGFDVKKSEVHGMAQRGGSVVSNVSYGEKIYSPLIAEGEANIILSFEQLETLRWIHYLNAEGIVISNTQKIFPLSVATGKEKYPIGIFARLEEKVQRLISINALEIAEKLGNKKIINTILVGKLANFLDISNDIFEKVIREEVPPVTVELNLAAFKVGNEFIDKMVMN